LRIFWELLRAHRLKPRVFDQLGADAHVCADEPFLRELVARGPRPRYTYSSAVDSIPPDARLIVLVQIDNELAVREALQQQRPDARVLSLLHDLLPMLLTSGPKPNLSRLPASPQKSYFLCCLPRSGSEFICSLMARNALGQPREHLKDELAACLSLTDQPAQLLDSVRRYGTTPAAIFGTKFIAHYLMRASDTRSGQQAVLEHMNGFDAGFRIRRPIEACVASHYLAVLRRKWHFSDADHAPAPVRWEQVDLNYVSMLIEHFQAQDRFLDTLCAQLAVPVTDIDYRDFQAERFATSPARTAFANFFGEAVLAPFRFESTVVVNEVDRQIKDRLRDWVAERLAGRPEVSASDEQAVPGFIAGGLRRLLGRR